MNDLDLDKVIALKQQTKLSYAELAQQLLGDRALGSALRSRVRRYQNTPLELPLPDVDQTFPILQAHGNSLVIADIHTPYQNTALLNLAIATAKEQQITQVDIAGDLHNFSALSSVAKHEPQTAAETDIQHARKILRVLMRDFEKVYIMSGNHDEYWTKKRGGTFQDLIYTEVLLGQHSNVFATNYDYIYRDDSWLIGHLSSYDETTGLLAAKIADIHNRHTLVGHDHIFGYKISEKGYIGASIGAMLTPELFYYKKRRLNTFPNFMLGFSIIKDNNLYMYDYTGTIKYSFDLADGGLKNE